MSPERMPTNGTCQTYLHFYPTYSKSFCLVGWKCVCFLYFWVGWLVGDFWLVEFLTTKETKNPSNLSSGSKDPSPEVITLTWPSRDAPQPNKASLFSRGISNHVFYQ